MRGAAEEQARAKRARLDDKHASKLRKRLAAGLEKLDQLGSVCVGHAVSRSGNVSLFKTATAAELHHAPLDEAEAELRAQLKTCAAAASRAEDPAPAEGGERGRAGAAGESAPAAATAAAVEQAAAAVAAAEAAAAAMAQAAAAAALAEAPAQGASSAAVLPAGGAPAHATAWTAFRVPASCLTSVTATLARLRQEHPHWSAWQLRP